MMLITQLRKIKIQIIYKLKINFWRIKYLLIAVPQTLMNLISKVLNLCYLNCKLNKKVIVMILIKQKKV